MKNKKPKLKLLGEDGNIFFILGRAQKAWKKAKKSDEEWSKIRDEVCSSNSYEEALQVIIKYFECE